MAFEPVLTSAVFPSPRVRVDFNSVPSGTVRARVDRLADGVTSTVRDGESVFAAGGFTLTDFEVPPGVLVEYRAEVFASDGGSLGFTGSSVVSVFTEPGWAWISDPLDPGNYAEVQQADTFARVLPRSRRVSTFSVSGRTVSLYGAPELLKGVPLDCYTQSDESRKRLFDVLQAGFVLVRTMPPVAIPRLLYVFVAQSNEIGLDISRGGQFTRWEFAGDEQSPTDTPVAVPAVSYQTYMTAYPTYANAMAVYETYLDAMKNPPGA